jgi:nucleotide-binding universal stress UspA family protein
LKPKHILFPVDFSEQCTAVAEYVKATAQSTGAKLTLLHVMEIPPPWYGPAASATLSALVDVSLVKESRQKEIETYLETQFHELAPLRLLAQGDPTYEILRYSAEQDVSLIMMPTRGVGPFRRYLLGSVAAKVLYEAENPVWTSSHSERTTPVRYPYRRILCAIDMTDRSIDVLQTAKELASDYDAELTVVHAINVNEESKNPGVLEVRKYLTKIAQQEWHRIKAEVGLETPFLVACGSVGAGIRKAAHDLRADIVVTGRGRMRQRLGRLRTNCYAIIRESPCPVLSV